MTGRERGPTGLLKKASLEVPGRSAIPTIPVFVYLVTEPVRDDISAPAPLTLLIFRGLQRLQGSSGSEDP